MTLRAGKTRAIREEGEKLAEGLGAAETRLALRGMDGSAAGWLDSVLALERLWALVEQTAFQRLCAECCWVGVQHSGRASAEERGHEVRGESMGWGASRASWGRWRGSSADPGIPGLTSVVSTG